MSINAWLPSILNTIAQERDVTTQNVRFALEDCIADCYYDHFKQNVSIRINMDGTIIAWFELYDYHKHLDIKRIPRKIIKQIKKKLPSYIQDIESSERYCYWRQFKSSAREGIIVRASQDKIDVDLGGQTGFMLKSHTIGSEKYIPGQLMQFFILKVSRKSTIYLNRRTKSLPEALLHQGIPWGTFRCTLRIPGTRSHVLTDIYLQNKTILRDVARELGEVITWKLDGTISRQTGMSQVV